MERPSLDEIFGKTAINQNRPSLDEIFSTPAIPPMTGEQRVSAQQMAEQIRPKREGLTFRDIGDIALSTGKGLVSGTESAVNGGTLGAYDWADRKFGLGAGERREELQQPAEQAGLGTANKVMQFAAEMGGNIAGGGGAIYKLLAKKGLTGLKLATAAGAAEGAGFGATSSDVNDSAGDVALNTIGGALTGVAGGWAGDKIIAPVFSKAVNVAAPVLAKGANYAKGLANKAEVSYGLAKLVKVLKKGEGFEDINFGRLTDDKIDSLNAIRSTSGQPLMSGERLVIPANMQKKWVEKRIKNDGLSPKELGEMLRDIFHTKSVEISPTKLPQNQALIDLQDDLANIGFVSVNPANKQSVVKSAYKTGAANVENVLFGKKNPPRETPNPLIDNQMKSELGSHGRLTDHSAGNKNTLDGRGIPSSVSQENPAVAAPLSALQSDNVSSISNTADDVNHVVKALADNEKMRGLRLGVEASDDVAKRIQREAVDVATQLNDDVNHSLNKALHHKIDTKKALANQGEAYQKVILQQGKEKVISVDMDSKVKNPTMFQKKIAKKAMQEADDMTNYPRGTIAHANKIKQELNAMEQSALAKNASRAKIEQIRGLQTQVNGTLRQNSTIKLRDERFAKAAKIDEAYEKGKVFNPEQLKNGLPVTDPLEKLAFLKGFIEKLSEGVHDTKNLAKVVDDNRRVFKKLLPENKYKELVKSIQDINLKYTRLGKLGARAEHKLNMPEKDSFFGREVLEGMGAMTGHAVDRTISAVRRGENTKRATAILDGKYDQMQEVFETSKAVQLGRLLGAYSGGKWGSGGDI